MDYLKSQVDHIPDKVAEVVNGLQQQHKLYPPNRAGGRGFGGSEYMFKYREPRTRFDPTSARFRIHPGLIEVMGLKRG